MEPVQLLNAQDHTLADLPVEVLNKIFKHIRGRDLLNISVVCKYWYSIIAESEDYMGKIRIKTDEHGTTNIRRLKKMLRETTRKYQHLSIRNAYDFHPDFKVMSFNWKSIQITRLTYSGMFINFLSNFSDTLQELEMFDLNFNTTEIVPVVEFPQLRVLKINCSRVESYFGIGIFKSTLSHLTELSISYEAFHDIFRNDATANMKINLNKLEITRKFENFKTLDMVEDFLRTQKNCLEEIKLDSLEKTTLEVLWNEMNVIRKVTIGSRDVDIATCLNLHTNETIHELRVQSNDIGDTIYEMIFNSTPNLRSLIVPKLDQNLLEVASENLKKLEYLHCWNITSDYPNGNIKFKRLKRIAFCDFSTHNEVANKMLHGLSFIEQKQRVLKWLTKGKNSKQ